jgi:ankyrin repeat protein
LSSAVAAGDLRQTAELLDQGADGRQADASGRTPLLLAVIAQRPDLVRLLLAHGADPNVRDQAGQSPLDRARLDGRTDIASLLEAAGAR